MTVLYSIYYFITYKLASAEAPMIRPLPEVTREAVARLDIRLRLVIEAGCPASDSRHGRADLTLGHCKVMLAPRSPIAWPSVTRGHVRRTVSRCFQYPMSLRENSCERKPEKLEPDDVAPPYYFCAAFSQ